MTFEQLSIHPKILKAVAGAGYTQPTQIQLRAIPKIIKGFDIRASAQTGTGKTAAFLLPALNRLIEPAAKQGRGPRLLILVPTRELAMQIADQAEKYSKYLDRVNTVCLFGGVPYHTQERKLSRPHDIIIATPGRLIDFLHQRKVDLSRVEMLVLDEADRMLDMGFTESVEEIVAKTPDSRQTLLFSATLRGNILKLSDRLMNKPMEIVVHAEKEKHENISQKLHYVDDLGHKNRLLDHILIQEGVENTIIFTATKRHAGQLSEELKDKGHKASALHGDMNQRQRTRTIAQLREGRIDIVVATDVAARGIDVTTITHVINFDLPNNAEDYVHRIGRTGRAGATGTALSFASGRDSHLVKDIERFTGQMIDVAVIAGLEPSQKKRFSDTNRGPRSGNGAKRPFKPGANRPFKAGSKRPFKPGSKKPSFTGGDSSRRSEGDSPRRSEGKKNFKSGSKKPKGRANYAGKSGA